MEKETKLRALCILKILYELSDVDHQLSTVEIAELLEEKYGLKVYRTTINSDIEQLRQFGIDICINKSTQNGDYYYVIGYSDKHQDIGSFRVDRIYKQPKIMKEDAIPRPEDFDEAEYVKTMFHMYSTKPQMVELICDNDIMDTIIDKFGEDVKTYAYSLSSFKAEVEVATSHVFYSWVFGFGGRVIIKGPESVKREYAEMVKAAAAGL